MAGGHAWWGHAWQGDMHGRGVCGRLTCMAGGHVWQGVCMSGGHAWQEKWQLQRAVRILLECILVYKYNLYFVIRRFSYFVIVSNEKVSVDKVVKFLKAPSYDLIKYVGGFSTKWQ